MASNTISTLTLSEIIDCYVTMLRAANPGTLKMECYPHHMPFSDIFWSTLSIRLSNHAYAGILKFYGKSIGHDSLKGSRAKLISKEQFKIVRKFNLTEIVDPLPIGGILPARPNFYTNYSNVRVSMVGINHFLLHHEKTSVEALAILAKRTRTDLLEKVASGEISPEEAEVRSEVLGLGILASAPSSGDFDPSEALYWTLPMCVAWIATRKFSVVRSWWDIVALKTLAWPAHQRSSSGASITLQSSQPKKIRDSDLEVADLEARLFNENLHMPYLEAKEVLWRALVGGQISGSGWRTATSERTVIRSEEWIDLIVAASQNQLSTSDLCSRLDASCMFLEVKLKRTDILHVWPAVRLNEDPAGGVERRILNKKELVEVYKKRRDDWPADEPFPSPLADLQFLKKFNPKISREKMREIRSQYAPKPWQRAGRK